MVHWSWYYEITLIKKPEKWKSTLQTDWECYINVAFQHALTKSQIFTLQSPDPVTKCVPWGWNDKEETQSEWPYPHIINYPFGQVHNFQVESSDAVAIISFLGEKAIDVTAYKCPL